MKQFNITAIFLFVMIDKTTTNDMKKPIRLNLLVKKLNPQNSMVSFFQFGLFKKH